MWEESTMRNLFSKKLICKTKMQTSFIPIIPYVLYVSRSVIDHGIENHAGYFYAISVTPFFTFGFSFGKSTRRKRESPLV